MKIRAKTPYGAELEFDDIPVEGPDAVDTWLRQFNQAYLAQVQADFSCGLVTLSGAEEAGEVSAEIDGDPGLTK